MSSHPSPLPAEAYLAALAGLPAMGPRRLLALSLAYDPADAWLAVASGHVLHHPGLVQRMGANPPDVAERWRVASEFVDPGEVLLRHQAFEVVSRTHPRYPEPLRHDLEPPAVLFQQGDPAALHAPRVGIVGTRACTRGGAELAGELGHDLAAAGVAVVSGLALGIDGAAHRGALQAGPTGAPPVGVVASGLDRPYPSRHRDLWSQVAERGLLLTECPVGVAPEAWRFPARNRVIAALSQVVVVVESARTGGSMYTVEEALRRDITVMAVPGPPRAPASAGTNHLLFEGAQMVRDAADVLSVLGLAAPRAARRREARPRPDLHGRRLLRTLAWDAMGLDQLVSGSGLTLAQASVALAQLEDQGWVVRRGMWIERVGGSR